MDSECSSVRRIPGDHTPARGLITLACLYYTDRACVHSKGLLYFLKSLNGVASPLNRSARVAVQTRPPKFTSTNRGVLLSVRQISHVGYTYKGREAFVFGKTGGGMMPYVLLRCLGHAYGRLPISLKAGLDDFFGGTA